jgi:hypothetical protein
MILKVLLRILKIELSTPLSPNIITATNQNWQPSPRPHYVRFHSLFYFDGNDIYFQLLYLFMQVAYLHIEVEGPEGCLSICQRVFLSPDCRNQHWWDDDLLVCCRVFRVDDTPSSLCYLLLGQSTCYTCCSLKFFFTTVCSLKLKDPEGLLLILLSQLLDWIGG